MFRVYLGDLKHLPCDKTLLYSQEFDMVSLQVFNTASMTLLCLVTLPSDNICARNEADYMVTRYR